MSTVSFAASFAIAAWALGGGALAAPFEVEILGDTGPPDNRVNLVILGDGYLPTDQGALSRHAQIAVTHLFSRPPLAGYRDFFNISLVHVVSEQRGADGGSYGPDRETTLHASYEEGYLIADGGRAWEIAQLHVDQVDLILVAVNDKPGGGTASSIATYAADNGGAGDVAVHEVGHLFAGLADEYEAPLGWGGCGGECVEPNVTTVVDRARLKWGHWIADDTPLPTPEIARYDDTIGLFEGAQYVSTGVYRPRQSCIMRSTVEAGDCPACETQFCEVCREALVRSVYRRVSPIDAVSPAGPIAIGRGERASLAVQRPHTAPSTTRLAWWVDGRLEQLGGDTLEIAPDLFPSDGTHTVRLDVTDETEWVRDDPLGSLSASAEWAVTVTGTRCGGERCAIGERCVADGEINPDAPCERCAVRVARTRWTADDTLSCDDGDFCTGTERCVSGRCETTGPPCDDGLFCNGREACVDGACVAGAAPCEDDGLSCTTTCVEEARACGVLAPGVCLVEDACYDVGAAIIDGRCYLCRPDRDPTALMEVGSATCGLGVTPQGPAGGETANRDGCTSAPGSGLWALLVWLAWLALRPRRARHYSEASRRSTVWRIPPLR